jgi:hypothetical protein
VVIHVFGTLVGDSGVDSVVFAYSSFMQTTFVPDDGDDKARRQEGSLPGEVCSHLRTVSFSAS